MGRPNVGKSTLFNRITRSKDALVDNFPGVTRDRNYGDARWDDVEFTLVDTGGFADRDEAGFADQIRQQVHQAIDDAELIVLVLDGKSGISPFDMDLISFLRDVTKPVFYVVNKIDGIEKEVSLYDFYSLGLKRYILFPLNIDTEYMISWTN